MTPDTNARRATMRKARDSERARLEELARHHHPDLAADDLDAAVRAVEAEKLSRAGRLGRARQTDLAALGRQWETLRPHMEATLQKLLDQVRGDAA